MKTLEAILALAGRSLTEADRYNIIGRDPVLPTRYKMGTAASCVLTACGIALNDLYELQGGTRQPIKLEMIAAAAAMRAHTYNKVYDQPKAKLWGTLSGFYTTKDNRTVQLHCNFPHHERAVMAILHCEADKDEVTKAVATWEGQALEDAITEADGCAALVRTQDEWHAHPHYQAIQDLPLFTIEKIANSAPKPLEAHERPLANLRVLEFTHVLAGPVTGRTLAEFGADVLRISHPARAFVEALVHDTGHGKRNAHLNWSHEEDYNQLAALARSCDVIVNGFRPGTLAQQNLAAEDVVKTNPNIIYVDISAYGDKGPWGGKRGFDALVQSVSGIAADQGTLEQPKHLPAQAIDYLTGYLAAFAVMSALKRRATEGGAYRITLSLAQTGQWLQQLGKIQAAVYPDISKHDITEYLVQTKTPFGTMRHMTPVLHMGRISPHWNKPAAPLGFHKAVWVPAELGVVV
jgi:crotonobetainyl-CoA:carnitine CoA-transferase CaiB-like acyl-CoA transferase